MAERPRRVSRSRAFKRWAVDIGFERIFAIILMVVGGTFGILTYLALTDVWDTAESPLTIRGLLLADLSVALVFAIIIARRAVMVWLSRRKGLAGAKLHSRMIVMFGLIAVTPAILVSVFSAAFLDYGLNNWFSDRVRNAIEASLNVANSYLAESQQRIVADTAAIAAELRLNGLIDINDQDRFQSYFDQQLNVRGLSEGVIFDRRLQIVARSSFSVLMEMDLDVPEDSFDQADRGETAVIVSPTRDRVRALIALDPVAGLYLYTGRLIDDKMLSDIRGTEDAARLYHKLERDRSSLQITSGVIYAVLALLMLLGAIWYAIISASKLVKPVSRLAQAAQKIGDGDLSARVKVGSRNDELAGMSRTFNVMASQLQSQQAALIAANRDLNDRSRLTSLILSGVSAGVIGVTENGIVDFANRSASMLVGLDLEQGIGQPISDLIPEMTDLLGQAQHRSSGTADGQISLNRNGATSTFHVRVVSERGEDDHMRLVITFDDVTELLSAQRKAAWSDIARRIAHEIKNPLTPIQLSAERLKRKYLKQISEDPDTFTVCTDTIIRQVGDIGRMVDEFSAFARMPAPVLNTESPVALAKELVFLQQSAHPGIEYSLDLPEVPVTIQCDSSQFNRALTNLLQNAADAIDGRMEDERAAGTAEPLTPGHIHLWIRRESDALLLSVADNGKGLPKEGRERLTEPYVTTRSKGTGLGLAIVKKIMEDHGGRLSLADRPGGGAVVTLSFPLDVPQMRLTDGADTAPGLQIASR
jgi:two-component system nitrogen regulation sensor histidine kinase NtrY